MSSLFVDRGACHKLYNNIVIVCETEKRHFTNLLVPLFSCICLLFLFKKRVSYLSFYRLLIESDVISVCCRLKVHIGDYLRSI